MLLTITHAGRNTPDIGFLFRKNPARPRVSDPSHGRACVFYPEVSEQKMTGRRNPWLPRATAMTRSTSAMFCVGQGFRKGNPERLKARGPGRKRALAPDEFALGMESPGRFVKGEPLHKVHECVFGIPAMESEPVDPGL